MGINEVMCSKCGQAAQFKCERCLEPYCSSPCQLSDWQDHKSKCFKFPDLVPINIVKSVSNMHLDRNGGSQRRHGSTYNINDTRRHSNTVISNKTKTKALPNDGDFNMVPKIGSTPSGVSAIKLISEKPTTWRFPFPPSEAFFDAVIQFKEECDSEKRIVWITDLKYESSLRKLLSEINHTINKKCPCTIADIYVGALVAAPLEEMLYRAEVLESCSDMQKATVRLIDYGNELRVPYAQLFAPIPIMCNLNSYAFRICLPNDYGPVEIESILTLRILGEKQNDNYYNVECKMKSIALQLPMNLFNKEAILKFVKCVSNARNALLRLCSNDGIDDEKFDSLLNSPQSLISFEFEHLPQAGDFVAARTAYGWKRARVLGFYEKLHQFLIYAIDDGFISFSPQIKKLPELFITCPIRVFAISTHSTDCMLTEAMLSTANHLTLQPLPAANISLKDSKNELPCTLFDENRKLVDLVMVSVFTGSITELGIQLWLESISEGETVIISHVLSYKEIYITSPQNNEYPKIILSEYAKCIPFAADEIIKKSDIVVYSQSKGNKSQFCRGQVIKFECNRFNVVDIDSGCEETIDRHVLRKPTLFVSSLPVRCFPVILMFLENIPSPIANNRALEALETCKLNNVEFDVTFGENKSVDLLFRTKEKQSLCKKLLPMVFEPASNQTPNTGMTNSIEKTWLALSPLPNTPEAFHRPVVHSLDDCSAEHVMDAGATGEQIFTINDLEVIPIECGVKVLLYVLDSSTILNTERPYITAADYNNKEVLLKMEQYLKAVYDYCRSDKSPKNGYTPKKMEICLCVFSDDGEWYRALCIDHKSNDTFVVMFLDYGNISKVNKKHIMPMVADLMFCSNANMVYVEGITSKEHGLALVKIIEKNPVIYASVRKLGEEEAYSAQIYV